MSFGNRSSYATLKDAFGITEFESNFDTKEFELEKREISLQPVVAMESFDDTETEITCEKVQSHCKSCGCMNKSIDIRPGSWLNEILNLLLVCLLLWILIYRPNV